MSMSEDLTAEAGLRTLLAANRSIVGELSLTAVLRQVVEAARALGGARHAALAVTGAGGGVEQLVHTGMGAEALALVGSPEASFLEVPVRSRGIAYGTLYLGDQVDGRGFSAEDEERVQAVAATAGIAIENARLYADAGLRQDWLAAAGEVSRGLLNPGDDKRVILQRIADAVVRLAPADIAAVVLPTDDDPDSLEVAVVAGHDVEGLRSLRYPRAQTLDELAMDEGVGILLDDVRDRHPYVHLSAAVSVGPVMALPLMGEWGPRGVIVVGRVEARPRFTEVELGMAGGFASQAALALELADARADQQRLTALEDRHRIARDLHDHVIQRLYASGLSLQSALTMPLDPPLQDLITRTITDLSDTIRQIRTSIFALTDQDPLRATPRAAILDVVRRAGAGMPTSPRLSFVGPVDTAVDDALVGDLTAVVNEALTNIVRHARAAVVDVCVEVVGDQVRVTVTDDGVGLGNAGPGSGLENLRSRATRAGGSMTVHERPGGGLRLEWTARSGVR